MDKKSKVKCPKCGEEEVPIEKVSALICRKCRTILYEYHYFDDKFVKKEVK
jgi:ribosomal protein L37AE/L43A